MSVGFVYMQIALRWY